MADWRTAIGARDADAVVRLDSAFQTSPERYRDALAASAGGDADERVRAFSTRVLGKLKRPSSRRFEKLLQDKSAYVRQNAAWALGELAAEDGREAAKHALAELRHAKKRRPSRRRQVGGEGRDGKTGIRNRRSSGRKIPPASRRANRRRRGSVRSVKTGKLFESNSLACGKNSPGIPECQESNAPTVMTLHRRMPRSTNSCCRSAVSSVTSQLDGRKPYSSSSCAPVTARS